MLSKMIIGAALTILPMVTSKLLIGAALLGLLAVDPRLAAGGAPGQYVIMVDSSPEYGAMLNQWLMVSYCQHLARSGQPIPNGMTATPSGGDFVCTGTPTVAGKQGYMHFAVGSRLLQQEYETWGRAEISDILRKNPEMDQQLRNTYPMMSQPERQAVKDAAPVK